MPSELPRILLTVPQDLMYSIRDYANASEKPMATAVIDLLQDMKPSIDGATKILRQVKAGRVDAAVRTAEKVIGASIVQAISQQAQLPLDVKKPARKPRASKGRPKG